MVRGLKLNQPQSNAMQKVCIFTAFCTNWAAGKIHKHFIYNTSRGRVESDILFTDLAITYI